MNTIPDYPATHRIVAEHVLAREEYDAIDHFCADLPQGQSPLPGLATFLRERFGFELTLDPDIVGGYIADSSNLPGKAEALCRPRSERDCAAIARACFSAALPFTVCAGRSNLTGSATPEGGVIVSLADMTKPAPELQADALTVRAPVGMILEDLRKTVLTQSGQKLIFPVDPTSRTDAAVGGAVACNASGFTPGEIGATRAWVRSLDFVLPSGLAIRARRGQYVSADGMFELDLANRKQEWPVPRYPRPPIKNAGGPFSAPDGAMDFIDLVVGSEGLFGLVTGCTLGIAPRPAQYLDLFFSLRSEQDAVAFHRYLCALPAGAPGKLTAFEYFGVNCRRHMTHEKQLFPGENEVAIYIQVPLPDRSVEDAAEEWLGILAEADCGIDENAIMLLDNDRDRAVFQKARHSLPANSLEVVKHRGTFTIMTDTVVPPANFPAFLEFTHSLLRAEGLDYLAFGHLGDCHLHFMILPEANLIERGAAAYDLIIAQSAELGGVYSGEHGTGKRKRNDFLRCYGADAVEQVRRCKAAVDPKFLLNRGNVIDIPGSTQ